MHFGKIVKQVAYSKGLSAVDLADLLKKTVSATLSLYEQQAWNLDNIISVSTVLDHDFLVYLENPVRYKDSGYGLN